MNKIIKNLCLIFCCMALTFAFTGCSIQDIFGGGGKSAYQIAVDNGFNGTEEEWLNSFRNGAPGMTLYEEAVAKGYFTGTEEEFIMQTRSTGADTSFTYASNLAMRSSVKVVGQKTTSGTTIASNGSGTIISYDTSNHIAHIATCYHVIADSTNTTTYALNTIYVYFYGAEDDTHFAKTAKFIGGAIYSDVAFLQVYIPASEWNKYHLRVADIDTSDMNLGQDAVIVGNSNGKGLNAVAADISKQNQEILVENNDGSSWQPHIHVARVNSMISHGNSGGGLFDYNANMIGMMNAKSQNSEEESNFNYAIPAYVVKAIYTNVMNQNPTSEHPKLVKKYKLGLNLKKKDSYTDINDGEGGNGYIYPRDEVMVESVEVGTIVAGLVLNDDTLISATIKRGTESIQTRKINGIYALGELMWYAIEGDKVVIEYYDTSAETSAQIELSLKGEIDNWKDVGSVRGYATDLTKC